MSTDSKLPLPQRPRRTWHQWSKLARVRIGFVLMLIAGVSLCGFWLPRRNVIAIAMFGGAGDDDSVFQTVQSNLSPVWRPYFPWTLARWVFVTDDRVNRVHLSKSQTDPRWLHRLKCFPRLQFVTINESQLCSNLNLLSSLPLEQVEINGLVSESDLGHLRSLSKIELLYVLDPPTSGGGWENLAEVPSLTDVELVGATDYRHIFQQLSEVPQIEGIGIQCGRCRVSADDLALLTRLPDFASLDIDDQYGVDLDGLQQIFRMKSLQYLVLNPCPATVSQLGDLAKMPVLREVTINGLTINIKSMRVAAEDDDQ
ncbi:MAG: hypothetical protein AABP62_09305 [Planctomycetota bacterium]